MPHNLSCPQCQKVGFVRVEYVINGTHSRKAFYCGGCDHTWSIDEIPPLRTALTPLPKPRTRYLPRRRKP
jgi:hypothetical protein